MATNGAMKLKPLQKNEKLWIKDMDADVYEISLDLRIIKSIRISESFM